MKPDAATAASEVLLREVYIPHFFSKLASHGIAPATEKEAEYLFNIGNQLVQSEQLETVKQAEASSSFYETASNYLDQALGARSAAGGRAETARVKQAAARHLADPAVVAAAITLQDAAFGALRK